MKDSLVLKDNEFQLINELLEENFGIYFPDYKKYMLESKLKSRVNELGFQSFMDYYLHLQFSMSFEKKYIAQLLTNNETFFFRETYQIEAFMNNGLEDIKKITNNNTIKFLIAGSSGGEEAYTLNILLMENKYKFFSYEYDILGIDIDLECIVKAKKAEYSESSMRALDDNKINKYFIKDDRYYKLKSMYKNNVRFEYGNIIDISTYEHQGPFDVVFCRNVLIYFSERSLFRAIKNFSKVIKKGGYLFLGHSESIIGLSEHFEPVKMGDCICYKKVD